jgi:uncharacterized membrane protein
MHLITSFIEWYFNIAPAEAGEGTAWEWVFLRPGLLDRRLLIVALLLVVLVTAVYRRDARSLRPRLQWALIGLRLLIFLMLLGIAGELTLSVTRTGLPFLPILVDSSRSMGLTDEYSDRELQQAAADLLQGSPSEDHTRLDLAKSILLRDGGSLLEDLEQRYRVRYFQFSDSARRIPVADSDGDDQVSAAAHAISGLTADGDPTRPGPAVQGVLDSLRGTDPAAMIVLTDGIASSSEEDRLSRVAANLQDRPIPLFPVAIGSSEPARDVELYDLYSETVAFLDDPITFEFRTKAWGYVGRDARFELRRAGSPDVLAATETVLAADGRPVSLRITFTPREEGAWEFRIVAPPLAGETNLQNNELRQTVHVRSEQIRVLLVERAPRWEYRHLKAVLERDETIALQTVLQESDLTFDREDRTALNRFPSTTDELFQYDVVIFGDVDLEYLNPGALDNLQEYVTRRGGGMIFIAGPHHNPLDYAGTPLEDLLPVDLASVSLPPRSTQGFRLELTRAGDTSPIFQIGSADPSEVWGRLPEMNWWIEAAQRKPGASVLAVHPTRHSVSGRLPVILLQRVGSGQILFHATDELWQFRKRREDIYYGRYWLQAVRFLARARLLSGARDIELTSDRAVYPQGEAIRLRARFIDPAMIPPAGEPVTAIADREGSQRIEVPLNLHEAGSDVYEGMLRGPAAGSYHVWLAAPATGDTPPACDFRVEVADNELQSRATDVRDLELAAELSGGRCLSPADVEGLLNSLPAGNPVVVSRGRLIPIWNRWEVLLIFVGLLTAEWLLRKRGRLI